MTRHTATTTAAVAVAVVVVVGGGAVVVVAGAEGLGGVKARGIFCTAKWCMVNGL